MYRSVLNSVSLPSISVAKKPLSSAVFWALSSSLMASFALAEDDRASPSSALLIQEFSIPSQPLQDALIQIGRQSKMQVSVENALVKDVHSLALRGKMTLEQALSQVLNGTGLTYRIRNNMINVTPELSGESSSTETLRKVTVIGQEVRFGDAPAEPGGFKAEYQSTATKMAMSLRETPQSVSTVTRSLLDKLQIDNIDQALEFTSGTQGELSDLGVPRGPFSGRGIRPSIFVIRANFLNSQGIKSDGFSTASLADIDLAPYERVEVIKGPGGFFGQGNIGGVINLVRKKPKAEFDASISGQAGSYDSYRTEADITGALTDDENVRGRLVAVYGDEGSFVDGLDTSTTLFAPSLEAIISDKTRVLVQALYQKEEFDINNGLPLYVDGDQVKMFDLPRSYNFGAPGDKSKSEIKDLSLRINHEFSDKWLGTLLLNHNKTTRDSVEGNYGYFAYGYVYVQNRREVYDQDSWAGEIRLEGAFDALGQEHRVLFGLERNGFKRLRDNGWHYTYDEFGNLAKVDLYEGNFADAGIIAKDDIAMDGRVGDITKVDNTAFYAQTVLSLTDHTKLLMNARYDKAEYKNTNAARDYFTEIEENEWTMRLGLTQEFSKNVSAYVTYGESFEPNSSDEARGGKPLKAKRGEALELGLKTDWFDNKLGASVAIYRQDLKNIAVNDPDNGPGENYSIAAGLHRTEGVELELAGSPMQGLNLALAATWMDNEFLDENDLFYGFPAGGTIDHQFSVYGNYEIQQGPLKGLATGLMWLHVGDRKTLIYNDDIDGYILPKLKGYDRVDLDFSYSALPNWDISLVVRNVLDKTYVDRATSTLTHRNFYGAPRSALFKATYNF